MPHYSSFSNRQPRDNRRNVNLNNAEHMLFEAISRLTGTPIAIIIREFALRHAIRLLMDNDKSILDQFSNTGAPEHLQRG